MKFNYKFEELFAETSEELELCLKPETKLV